MGTDHAIEPGAHYDRVTESWGFLLGDDLHYGLFERGTEDLASATAALTRRMAAAAALTEGLRVLDVGCGTGAPACHLVERYQVQVVGISTSATGVALARQRAADRGVDGSATFEERGGTANGLPDASFDRVWVLESSHLMRQSALISECSRVLGAGGRMVLCDIVLQRELAFLEVRRLLPQLKLLRAVFGAAHMLPLRRYAELAEANGLEVHELVDLTDAIAPTFARWRENAEVHAVEVRDLVGEEYRRQFIDAVDTLERFWSDGTLGYGLVTATRS